MYSNSESVKLAMTELGLERTKLITPEKIIGKFLKMNFTNGNPELIEHKNILLIEWIEKNKNPAEFNDVEVKIKDPCKICGGKGIHIHTFKVETEKCKLVVYDMPKNKKAYQGCAGTGWMIGQCNKCQGTGKIGENPCPTCFDNKRKVSRGTFQYRPVKPKNGRPGFDGIKCIICNGTGEVKKLVQRDSEIESVHNCSKCSGIGVDKNISTPVLDPETAIKVSKIISNK